MGTPSSTGKNRSIPAPNSGLGQSYEQGVSGYGTGKQRQAAGPSQFSGNVRPTRGVNAGAPDYSTGAPEYATGLNAPVQQVGKGRMPTAPVVGATGRQDEGNDIARVPRDEGNDTVSVGATPQATALTNALQNYRPGMQPILRTSAGVDTTVPVRSTRGTNMPGMATPVTNSPQTFSNTGVGTAGTTLGAMGLQSGGAAPGAPVLRTSTGSNTTAPVRSTRGTDVPGAIATVPPPVTTPVTAAPAVQYATANSGMAPGSIGAPAAYGIAPVAGTGPYDLAPNGQANWQANWQAPSAAAPTAAAPFGTDDQGNAFTSAAQAADWKRRVDARNAALSDYTFADQAASRGY